MVYILEFSTTKLVEDKMLVIDAMNEIQKLCKISDCLLYTSDAADD